MKKFIIFIIVVSAGIGVIYYKETSICRNPLAYDIGVFDSRFNISKDKFLKTIMEAEAVWEKGMNRQLFEHQLGAKFKINLVFDERQSKTIQATQSQQEIRTSRNFYDSLVVEYKMLAARYERDLAEYDAEVSDFETRLASYNREIAEINSQGGATPSEHKRLEDIRKTLEQEKTVLDSQRRTLNQAADELNSLGGKINNLASELNIEVDIHNQRFGEAREFDQGDYSGNQINIYQFDGISDLRLVLAHELGHALGISHVENPKSIMYYLMDQQDLQNPSLSLEDKISFSRLCQFHIPKLKEIFNNR